MITGGIVPFLRIDTVKCKRDNICVAECPMKIILASTDGAVPSMRMGGEDICIECGHCVSVCPWDALELEPITRAMCEEIADHGKEQGFTTEQAVQFLKTRRSIRTFRSRPVPTETLQAILDVLSFAPSAKNATHVSWVLVENKEKVNKLVELCIEWMIEIREKRPEDAKKYGVAGIIAAWKRNKVDLILHSAPHVLIAYTLGDSLWNKTDASIALEYAELAAHAYGVGSCFAGFFTRAFMMSEKIRDFCSIPEDAEVHGAHMLGYPVYRYRMIPYRNPVPVTWIK